LSSPGLRRAGRGRAGPITLAASGPAPPTGQLQRLRRPCLPGERPYRRTHPRSCPSALCSRRSQVSASRAPGHPPVSTHGLSNPSDTPERNAARG
jgi:hypothetical protein